MHRPSSPPPVPDPARSESADDRRSGETFPWISTSAAAALLGVSRHLVASWAREAKVYARRSTAARSRHWLIDVRSLKAYADLSGIDAFRPVPEQQAAAG